MVTLGTSINIVVRARSTQAVLPCTADRLLSTTPLRPRGTTLRVLRRHHPLVLTRTSCPSPAATAPRWGWQLRTQPPHAEARWTHASRVSIALVTPAPDPLSWEDTPDVPFTSILFPVPSPDPLAGGGEEAALKGGHPLHREMFAEDPRRTLRAPRSAPQEDQGAGHSTSCCPCRLSWSLLCIRTFSTCRPSSHHLVPSFSFNKITRHTVSGHLPLAPLPWISHGVVSNIETLLLPADATAAATDFRTQPVSSALMPGLPPINEAVVQR
ncbi:hypothetical protein PAPYR_6687 [Paratrimastix pyriformis]|uniref:Uncharacterized protein n=1 Tax=Paratrimastix pyriformis TaxID=342808 RepID=A0ABQ8UJ74_9EUKA|nr:hypothetical protein PAPYR_6687 [Paratrimastix pyriformis]